MRKTKIICTMGPATDDVNILTKMIKSGMNVARLNFSHGSHEDHKAKIETIRRISKEVGKHVAILLDTKGPEIRTGILEQNIELCAGEFITLTTNEQLGNKDVISISYYKLPEKVKSGDTILIDDGLIELEVVKTTDTDILCSIINGGLLGDKKGVNLPDISVDMPYMNKKDRDDIIFGIKNDVDFIAASFIRCKEDVLEVKKIIEENGGEGINIISKIENKEGVNNIDEIINHSKGIMIARGDLGVEIPIEEIPRIQKILIKKCYKAGKVAITATQMLDSMIRNPRPTRAEVTDVANAIYDGTSAIMLSGETAVGKYPLESFLTMDRIAEKTESDIDYRKRFNMSEQNKYTVGNAISHAACMTAHDLGASAIVAVTKSGLTARMISRFRPQCPIIATSTSEKACRQLALSWGVHPVLSDTKETTDEVFEHSVDMALKTQLIKNGDVVVLTGGFPVGISGTTNSLKVQLVGHVLCKGIGVNSLSVSGNLCVAQDEADAFEDFTEGNILVIKETTNKLLPIIKSAAGIIVEQNGSESHAAIVGMTLDIPVIIGAENATQILKSGTTITMDGTKGLVYSGVAEV